METTTKTLKRGEKPPRGIRVWWIERRKCWGIEWRERKPGATKKSPVMVTRKTKTEALAKAAEVESHRKRHGTENHTGLDAKSGRDWAMVREALEADGANVAQLLGVWERHKAEVIGAKAGLLVRDAVKKYLDLKSKEGLVGASYDATEKHLNRLRGSFGERPLVSVEAEDMRRWLDGLKRDEGFAAWTLIHHHKSAAGLFNRAMAEKWLGTNPMTTVSPPAKPKEEVEFLTIEEGVKLFGVNRDNPVSLRLALEAFGGLRYSGACRIEKDEVLWEERALVIPATKSKDGKRHFLQGMPDILWVWLERWRHRPEAWTMTPRQILQAKSEAFAKAGVANPGNGLRHSFCTYLIAKEKNAALTAYLMQHAKPDMLYRHYRGAATEADGFRWFGIHPWLPFIPEPVGR